MEERFKVVFNPYHPASGETSSVIDTKTGNNVLGTGIFYYEG